MLLLAPELGELPLQLLIDLLVVYDVAAQLFVFRLGFVFLHDEAAC
jgi:hypothetical protein